MSTAYLQTLLEELQQTLSESDADTAAHPDAASLLQTLVKRGLDRLPLPAGGATLQRWSALAMVAEHDLSLAKLYEGHTDAIAILAELEDHEAPATGGRWGVWASESPQGRTTITPNGSGKVLLHGTKAWCSGADGLSHALLTAWYPNGTGPQLVRVALNQRQVQVFAQNWKAVGMAGSASIDVFFDGAMADLVGVPGEYLQRPGFWHGGAGVAACWYGGARGLGAALRRAVQRAPGPEKDVLRLVALGKVDLVLQGAAAMLREAAQWMDDHPLDDASSLAWRVRLCMENCARTVLDEAGRALGAAAFCRDAHFARAAADLPVFVRQSHAERDFAELGRYVKKHGDDTWAL